jgi:hypothetical protein
MMSDRMALKVAIDLLHVPSQVRVLRAEPLPSDMLTLLRIATGDDEAETAAALNLGRPGATLRSAATFFIEQILFAPDADSYRVLGSSEKASAAELRRHVALLLRWLHPDLDPHGDRSIFVGRVTTAWNDLKTPERRATYDEARLYSVRRNGLHNGRGKRTSKHPDQKKRRAGIWRSRGRNWRPVRHLDTIGFFRRALAVLLQRPPQ